MDNKELDELENEIKKSFLELQQNIQYKIDDEYKKQALMDSAEITNNSLRMINEMRCKNNEQYNR